MISENDIEMDMEFCMYARREIYSWWISMLLVSLEVIEALYSEFSPILTLSLSPSLFLLCGVGPEYYDSKD